ncbi:MAG TPA: MarR family transcriptional regulator [Candidatus Dormibacteraeota bacterium]|nr:MarR family transcriptional regulator [Candidatus Dormibacteraeota bacterium]
MVQPLRLRHRANVSDAFEADRHGRLFDPAVRESFAKLGAATTVEPLETLAALRLAANRVHAAMERWTEAHGLSESRLRVLMTLYRSPQHRLPLGELAELLGVVPRTMTDVVDVLERDGLIRRTPVPNDRRSVHAKLTPAGLDRVESIRRDTVAKQSDFFASFKREELADLRHLCLLLVQRMPRNQGGS